jgi:hypothetical protein
VHAAAGRLSLGEAPRVCPVGGAFRSAILRAAFERAVTRAYPHARISGPRFDPAIGALIGAWHLAGLALDSARLAALEGSVAPGRPTP